MLVVINKKIMFTVSHKNKWLIRNFKKRDLSESNMTFGERIALGFASEKKTDSEIMKSFVLSLYGIRLKAKHYKYFIEHVKEVGEILLLWIKKEKELKYTPTPEEQEAGISKIGEKLQHFSTIDAIATRMTISHNDTIRLSYSIVFLMLQSDLEQAMFNRRLQKIHQQKAKKK